MSRPSIMIVDDEELLCWALKINLEKEGFKVNSALSAESALSVLKEQPFDLMITDYLMEGVNGIELMQQTKELYPEMKVFIFSGYEDEKAADEMRRLGADGFLCKPINLDNLLERITEVMTP